MSTEDHNPEEIFHKASEMTDRKERDAYLDGTCGGNEKLRAEVEALLFADEHVGSFLEPAPADPRMTSDNPPILEGPGARIGHYELLELTGEGGMGLVYLAEQKEPVRRRVAFKIIKPGMDSKQVIARFEAERQALAVLDHPNIAHVFDAGTTNTGRPYFVMEYVRGMSITRYCDEKKLTIEQRLRLFEQVCEAVPHAHQKGIIHRDLKPSNILVSVHGDRAVPKIIDFGIAKAITQPLTDKTFVTVQGHLLGTPEYMSPEQVDLATQDIDTRSDIYSLGVVLYELLAGVLPFEEGAFERAGLAEIQQTIREREPVSPSTRLTGLGEQAKAVAASRGTQVISLARRLHRELEWIPLKAMRKDRCRRYRSASEMADDVRKYLAGLPLLAGPETTIYRVQKFVRKHAGSVMTVALVAAAIVLGLLVSIWQATVATNAKNEALRSEAEKDRQAQIALEERDKAVAAQHQAIAARRQAVTAQQQAEEQRQRAEASEQHTQNLLYAANMNLAQHAWEENNMGRLRQLLEETASYPQRGFEWYYWQRQRHLEIRTLYQRSDTSVLSVAFSPDGRLVITGSLDFTGTPDGTAKIWDADSGKELLALQGHHIISVAFSPDSQLVCTGDWDGTVKVWEAIRGKELLSLKGHSGQIFALAFSPDGQRIVTGGADQTAKVWETASGKELLTLKGHNRMVRSVAFSPDGRRIVTAGDDATAKVWEAASSKELITLQGHKGTVISVSFSPDGKRIVTGSGDGSVKLWEASTGKDLLTLQAHGIMVTSVGFSPDGRRVVTGGGDNTAKVWEASRGKELFRLRHSSRVLSVAFSPDGQRIVTGTIGGAAKIWDANCDKGPLSFDGHTGTIFCVAFSPNGGQLATASADRMIKMWDVDSGKELSTLEGHSDQVRSVAFSPDGQRLCTGSADRTAKAWEAVSGSELLTLKGHNDAVSSVAFSPDSQSIVTGSRDGTAKIWEAASGKELLALGGHSQEVWCVAFSPDGQRVVTGACDQTAKVWEATSGRELLTLKGHGGAIFAVAFSPDGRRVITGSNDMMAKVWDTVSGKELLTLKGHSDMIRSVAFSPGGRQIVTGACDGTAIVWQAASSEQVGAWQQQEKAAAERLVTMRIEQVAAAEREKAIRAQDPGAIKQWLVLAPLAFDGRDGAAALAALDQQQIPQEATVRPRAGERIKVGQIERTWKAVQQEGDRINFNRLLGEPTNFSVAYAACYIDSDGEHADLMMKVGSGAPLKVYLNGQEVCRREESTQAYAWSEADVRGVKLESGLNVLVFKVVNLVGDWHGAVWLTDAAGQPVKGIHVTLEPPEAVQR